MGADGAVLDQQCCFPIAGAESMLKEASSIYERLRAKRESADLYWNIGLFHARRENMDMAREAITKARELYAKVGLAEGVTRAQTWIDSSAKAPPEAR